MSRHNNHTTQCNNDVKVLCNRALAFCDKNTHDKCKKKRKASLIPGSEINIFLQSLGSSEFGTDSREGITIKATAVEDDKEYYVCANFKQRIKASQGKKKRERVIVSIQKH